ncbi:crotonase/enoyl-CoA hydratase family protein [Wenxinia marina]|uniref:Vanillin synthase/trans-feruloyl-CoA hydratase n=1 Tax=Wenxinia marina DSM 24838 TaxID=1123501 RepID=A0A0D0Q7J0_9RHOB|nr:crotonase/enoyl-CoA hydratase family protein [Wenxinia marina]KIQ70419.1 vanillin synthase/trans-feruloyl-CoA hydratase [Wenxinia marina DSM 24838]GGL53323.1 enoyl-CoA hydratase [Wenxinia marina]
MDQPASSGLVTYELRGQVAIIGLDRPEKRNAISDRVVAALTEAVVRASSEAKAAVLTGRGPHFCAGLDLAEHVEKPLIEAVKGSRTWHRSFDLIERGAIPFVAAMQGAVVGGGFELAAAAQIRVAESGAFFGLPEGQRGIFVGGGGSVRIARLIGAHRMADMMLTGRTVGAAEMERWGGVNYVTGEGEALDKAVALAERMAENAEMSNYAVLNALPRIRDMSSEDGLFVESIMSALTTATPEAEARLRAFLEKRAGKVEAPKDA